MSQLGMLGISTHVMKTFIRILLVVTIFGFVAMPSHAGTSTDQDLTKKLSDVLTAWEKITPGTTRAALTNAFTVEIGAVYIPPSSFQQHQRFVYRGCDLIKVDVDFAPSDSKEARPTDTIVKISQPYLAWNPTD